LVLFPGIDDEKKKYKEGTFLIWKEISQVWTPREMLGSGKRFEDYFRTVNGNTIAVERPISQEYRRRGLVGAEYENFRGDPIKAASGVEFFRTARKEQGGPGVMRRQQNVDDVITYITKSDFNQKPKERAAPKEPQRKTQSTNTNRYIQSVSGGQRPQQRTQQVNAGINKFNSIVGNTSARKKKRNTLW